MADLTIKKHCFTVASPCGIYLMALRRMEMLPSSLGSSMVAEIAITVIMLVPMPTPKISPITSNYCLHLLINPIASSGLFNCPVFLCDARNS